MSGSNHNEDENEKRLSDEEIDKILNRLAKNDKPEEQTKETRVFGPPGTGKTGYLKRQTTLAVDKFGPDQVLVASYTRAAAATLVSRDLGVDRNAIGTLHALCYRQLESPEIAERHIDEFNAEFPGFQLSNNVKGSMEESVTEAAAVTDGDKLFTQYRLQRARMLPVEQLPPETIAFVRAWDNWKSDCKYIDFTDMIDYTLRHKSPPPGNRKIGLYDEAQDFNRLEMALVRMWAQHQEYVILAGDDDQALYGFCGGTADAFLNPPIPQDHKRVLSQSWRVPRAVHAVAQEWISQLTNREPKEYKPRDFEGEIRRERMNYAVPGRILKDAQRYLDAGKTVMFLASCGYMLDRLKEEMRGEGIPFHNPYKRNRGDWNPLGDFGKNRRADIISSKDRIFAFLNTDGPSLDGQIYWPIQELAKWVDVIKTTGILKRGAKAKIEAQAEFPTLYTPEEVSRFHHECFEENALKEALARDISWLRNNLTSAKIPVLDFPIKVYNKNGLDSLNEKPQIILSTIHGVKGGEADCSPYDEPVLTVNRGYVPIGELNPDIDKLASFNSDHHKIHRGGPRRPDGYKFTKGQRPYNGPLLTITTNLSKTRLTTNHYLTVRWAKQALRGWCVYLMKRGNFWRIGITRLHQKRNQAGLLMRMRREKAEAGWILKIFDTQHEALYHETLWSHKFHVPDLVFEQRARNGNQICTDDLMTIWKSLDIDLINRGARDLLASCGKDPAYPMWEYDGKTRRIRQTGTRNRWLVRACNLFPGYMELPCDPGKGQNPKWLPFVVTNEQYSGIVYSLDVERWHHYISGGLIVHNCVYVSPDLSLQGLREWQGKGEGHDAIVRMFYVGMTRAKESLVICDPATQMHVRL